MAIAAGVEINGVYYNLDSQTKTAEVTYNDLYSGKNYSGEIVIPNTVVYEGTTYTVTSIGEVAFWYCESLTSVTIPSSVTSIGEHAFNNCSGLTSIIIPDGVTDIGEYAFFGCSGLISVTIGNSVTTIGESAFSICKGLTSVTIGNSVTTIGKNAFSSCSGLTSISIPNSVTTIGDYAFNSCNLTKIVILANNCSIGNNAFYYWGDQPQDVFIFSQTPPSLSNSTTFVYGSIIYVYQQAVDAYKSGDNWKYYVIFGLGDEDMKDFSQNGFHYGDGINSYLRCGITSISKVGSTIGSTSYIRKTFAMFLTNKHTDAITIKKVVAKDPSTNEELATLKEADLGELKGGETMDFSITIKKDLDPIYEIYYTYKDRLSLFSTSANDKRQYDLAIQSTGNGKVICEGQTVQNGSASIKLDGGTTYTITITPDNGYCIDNVTVNNSNVTSQVVNGQYTFKMTGNTNISVKFKANKYKLTYTVDGNVYKTYDVEYGASITPEAAPTKTGYTFSGWSNIPATMPAKDITVTGTFTVNKYKLIYKVDGEIYKTIEKEYGASIKPEAAPTKTGYTFSGWSNIPSTMPAKDVTVTGSFTINKYKLTYKVDGTVYKTYQIEYGTIITPEVAPTKTGYTFSGWSYIPSTMPAEDVTVTGTFTANTYKLTYYVDGEVYKTYDIRYGTSITPEKEPTKDGYVFSGWSEIPRTMPAYNVDITGTFSKGSYKLTYVVDGVTYKTVNYDYGKTITPEAEPTKIGYTFSGWSYIPSTMPAEDVTVTGTITVNKYKLIYMVDGAVYKTYEIEYGANIALDAEPTKEGYTFSGWSWVPSKMPAENVTVTGTFTVNKYKLIYKVDGVEYRSYQVEYGASITPIDAPIKEGYDFSGWDYVPETMPAHDVIVNATFTLGITDVMMASGNVKVFDTMGNQIGKLKKGVNIIRTRDGKTKKVMVK